VRLSWLLALALGSAIPQLASAAPPASDEASEHGRVTGRVLVAGTRAPVAEAKLMVVAAPPDVRVGARAREPLDPASVDWVRETLTDEDGRFELDALPTGNVRVVVVVEGYERVDMWAEASPDAKPLVLFLRPTAGRFRTEVVVDRHPELPDAEHQVDAERARVYPGSGGDPVRATQNLPGVARAPGGLGLMAIRGGDPRQTGIYVDGHPVPRAFHVLPIAAVVDPSMLDRVELTPGNFDAAYGGFSGGLLELHTRRLTDMQGIHGEAHVDLFDVGAATWGPVGRGGVAVAVRRAHVGDVVKTADTLIGKTGVLVPNYWDYFGRFDLPIGRRHLLSVKSFGAGDALQDKTKIEPDVELSLNFRTEFHRFDLGYAYEGPRLRASLSGALLLESSLQEDSYSTRNRRGRTPSVRGVLSYRLAKRATLLGGLDFVHTHAFRQSRSDYGDDEINTFNVKHWRFGTWLGVAWQLFPRTGLLVIRPQVRLNVFGTADEARASVDFRLDVRARVHPRVELFAAVGRYSAPFTLYREDQLGLIEDSETTTAHIVVPDWLSNYFDPGAESEVPEGFLVITKTYQASLGTQVQLPWSLGLRATLFWRERPEQLRALPMSDGFLGGLDLDIQAPTERAYGLEFLLDRRLAERIHGMIGYTLLRAEAIVFDDFFGLGLGVGIGRGSGHRVPTNFDQRHNLVMLLVFELPRAFRFGARFRLVSGNPEQPVIGTKVTQDASRFYYEPIYGEFGSSYAPLFHQLDLRLDKTWFVRRLALIGYLDVQNVYNRIYPEIWVYSIDWTERGARIGLPIFPSLGVRVEF
jgi:hypothetical protein